MTSLLFTEWSCWPERRRSGQKPEISPHTACAASATRAGGSRKGLEFLPKPSRSPTPEKLRALS